MKHDPSLALERLNKILTDAAAHGAEAVEFEFNSGRQLEVTFHAGNMGIGSLLDRESGNAIMDAIYEQQRKLRGQVRLTVQNRDYLFRIQDFDSFGDTAYRVAIRLAKR